MDLYKTIKDLQEEKRRLDLMIELLESRLPGDGARSVERRRGRKSMNESEKSEVSRRMKAYWAARKKVDDPPTE
jgi:hypothetical protein